MLKFVDQGWVEALGGQGAAAFNIAKAVKLDFVNFAGLKTYLLGGLLVVGVCFYCSYLGSLKRA